ncbi:MAG: hypothetical protein AAB971_02170 [Patescibacteria group bacterium]
MSGSENIFESIMRAQFSDRPYGWDELHLDLVFPHIEPNSSVGQFAAKLTAEAEFAETDYNMVINESDLPNVPAYEHSYELATAREGTFLSLLDTIKSKLQEYEGSVDVDTYKAFVVDACRNEQRFMRETNHYSRGDAANLSRLLIKTSHLLRAEPSKHFQLLRQPTVI